MLHTCRRLFTSLNNCRKSPALALIFVAALLLALVLAPGARARDLSAMTVINGKPAVFTDGAGGINNEGARLTVNAKADQTITFGPLPNKTFGDADFTVSASASSGLPVSFTASGNCTVSGSTVHITGAGSCTVTASQGGDANFNPAPDVAQSFQIAKANQTITFVTVGDRRFGSVDFPLSGAASASSGLAVTFSASGGCTIVNGNTVHITAVGTCSITASQAGDSNYNAAPSVTRSFQVTKVGTYMFLYSSPEPSAVGEQVTLSATVVLDSLRPSTPTAAPTGTVQFEVDNNNVGGPVNCTPGSGNFCTASIPTSFLTPGLHGLRANYSGDANFYPSWTLMSHTVASVIIEFSESVYLVTEREGSVNITVTRRGDTTQPSSVDYSTDDGSTPSTVVPCSATTGHALERCDYTRAAGTLSFAPNETQKYFTVLVNDDSYVEGQESLSLHLSNPSSNVLLGQSATLYIGDGQPESTGNPNDDPLTFVREHYHDFLNREPDTSGLQFWTNQMTNCGASDTTVCHVSVSAAFFLSIEFQQTGYLAERMYKVAYGDAQGASSLGSTSHSLSVPIVRLNEFLADTQRIGQGVVVGQGAWQQQLEVNKNAFAQEFVSRQRFTDAFPSTLTADEFVSRLDQNAGRVLTADQKAQLVSSLGATPADPSKRAAVLRQVAENSVLNAAEFNRAFVLMQYFGYLRRNPNDTQDTDYTGYEFWLRKLEQFNGNFVQAEMVKAFISSTEYRQRFGQ